MGLPTSGSLSISQIAAEFGGAAPHGLNEYYGVSWEVPTSGTISINNFYGRGYIQRYTVHVAHINVGGITQDGYALLEFGNMSPSLWWRHIVVLGASRHRQGNAFNFTMNGVHARNRISRIVTQDGWDLYTASAPVFFHEGDTTRWSWHGVPMGGWDGTVAGRTRWIDIYP